MISHLTANQQTGKRGNPTLKNKGKNNKSRTEEQLEQHHSHMFNRNMYGSKQNS
jgi:hypothetical protein